MMEMKKNIVLGAVGDQGFFVGNVQDLSAVTPLLSNLEAVTVNGEIEAYRYVCQTYSHRQIEQGQAVALPSLEDLLKIKLYRAPYSLPIFPKQKYFAVWGNLGCMVADENQLDYIGFITREHDCYLNIREYQSFDDAESVAKKSYLERCMMFSAYFKNRSCPVQLFLNQWYADKIQQSSMLCHTPFRIQ